MGLGTRRLTWRRRLLFNTFLLVGTWILIESLSVVTMLMLLGSPGQLAIQRQTTAAQDPFNPGGQHVAPAVIHPYIGAVMQPKDNGGKLSIGGKFRVTEFGFVDEGSPIHRRSPDRVIVGILGGSVARQFGQNATDTLAAELSLSPQFAGRQFQFVRLASDGYKQPQQLMIVNYLLTLGAEFDVIINLDGVNEAALPKIDNVSVGVFAAYPRDWGKMIAGTASPEFVRMAGYVAHLRKGQRDDALWFGSAPWNMSMTAQLVWGFRKNQTDHAIMSQLELMNDFTKREMTYCGSGPPEHFDSDDDVYTHCTELWCRSSILLHQLCAAQGIRYFHFLQPNQYVPGSKPIGAREANVAINEGNLMCLAVRACFPMMKAQATRLAESGVSFNDLTSVFADHPEPIYNDVCCHMEPSGDLIMAKAIAARIRQLSQ